MTYAYHELSENKFFLFKTLFTVITFTFKQINNGLQVIKNINYWIVLGWIGIILGQLDYICK